MPAEMDAYEFAKLCNEKLVEKLLGVPDMVEDWEPMDDFDTSLPTCLHWPVWPGLDSYRIPLFEARKKEIHEAILDENGNELVEWDYPAHVDVTSEMDGDQLWIQVYLEIGWESIQVFGYTSSRFTAEAAELFAEGVMDSLLGVKLPA